MQVEGEEEERRKNVGKTCQGAILMPHREALFFTCNKCGVLGELGPGQLGFDPFRMQVVFRKRI